MTLYIWKRVLNLTDNYHSEGGALAVAASLERARALIADGRERYDMERPSGVHMQEPDYAFEIGDEPELAVVFPDKGCC
jgi:hypothetical protein